MALAPAHLCAALTAVVVSVLVMAAMSQRNRLKFATSADDNNEPEEIWGETGIEPRDELALSSSLQVLVTGHYSNTQRQCETYLTLGVVV